MNTTERIATLRAALEKAHLRGNYCTGVDVYRHDTAIDAALAATAEPVKPRMRTEAECMMTHHHSQQSDCESCRARADEPSPAPRDAEREALLAFGEKVREACSGWARQNVGKEAERDLDNLDLAALLPVKQS